ncbi:MAG: TIM barrel protein [Lachnospiraceae bacterium]
MIKTSASITVQYDSPFAPYPAAEWKNAIKWVSDSGFDGVELIVSDPNLLDAEQIARYAQMNNLEISTVSTGQATGLEGISLTSPAQYIREAAFKRICDDIDFSEKIGYPNVTIGLIRGKGGILPHDVEYSLLVTELKKVCEYAAKKEVKLNFEPINMFECKLINTTEEGYQLLKDLGSPDCMGLLYDTFHANIGDHDTLTQLQNCADKLFHVHFSDSNRRLPGEGNYDYRALNKLLREIDYEGYVSLEVFNAPSAKHIIANAKKQVDFALS